MDEAFVLVSVISGLFTLAGISLWQHNWFKRERFKIEAFNLKKSNDLQLKKMARDLGLDTGKTAAPTGQPNPLGLLDMARQFGLSKSQIGDIIDVVAGGPRGAPDEEEEEPSEEGVLGSLAKGFLQSETGQNLIQGAVKGVTQGNQTQNQNSQV